MNIHKPRYGDSNRSENSWQNSNPRRNVNHSTGRSNYGGSGGGGGLRKDGNPIEKIGKFIKNRRQRHLNRQRSSNGGAVGTEANALKNMERNAKHFDYPPEGFVTPIEHSLLYAMVEFPERYPESVVKSEIEDEEFDVYLYINDKQRKGGAAVGGDTDDRREIDRCAAKVFVMTRYGEQGEKDEEGSDHAENDEQQTTTAAQSQSNGEERVSYAQLSALAALSAEKNPCTATPNQNDASNSASSKTNGSTDETLSIGQTLVRKLLRTITRYSDANSLDRQTEIREFLTPIEKRCQMRNEKAALQQLLPAYAGYTLSLVTGNPLPLLIGAAALTGPDPMLEENTNVKGFRSVGGRAGDLETAGLLDECDSD